MFGQSKTKPGWASVEAKTSPPNPLGYFQNLLLERETQMEKLKEDFLTQQKAVEQKCLELEKKLTIATALVEYNTKREQEYQHQIETLRQEAQKAELKSAVSETKLIELEKQLNRYENTKAS